ncbi:YihY/virulence factor BrkB family protein [Phycicoccus sonneratiae]|uniref:YihY/virulence factor BrkB family protein n=1 Tax=Phycicoccus sonneratiae TaxID=2807628 RepID=A0ABS2CQY4_9MICO|nr:YihY/virulence factor BrkB family protein [Phycicoccus sonneraticus]MBM6402306.1 YihY/virulence factor BrkB family protein [Phycicoccus sonneraticus]
MATQGAARERTAPPADHGATADSPTDVSPRGWRTTATSAFSEFQRDQCTDLAAALTYYSVLAVFPAILALVSLLGVFGQGESTTQALLDVVRQLGQTDAAAQLEEPVRAMVGASGAGFALVLGIATALFSASGYVGAFGRAMNRVYQVPEGRPVWKLRPQQVLITLGLVLMAAIVLVGLVVSGPLAKVVGSRIGLEDATVTVFDVAKWPVMLGVVVVMVAVLYYWTPNVRQPRFRWVSVGAGVAIVAWVLASVGFGFYVTTFGSYAKTYGSLAGIVVFLLWLWITNLALLFGAEVDAELERVRELESGIKAERSVQLPLKDSSGADKARGKYDERVREGRRIRRRAGAPDARGADGGAGATLEPLPSETARAGRHDR